MKVVAVTSCPSGVAHTYMSAESLSLSAKKYGVDRPEYYADLAKAFLHDKDYKGKPEEKLWYYYNCIVLDE